MREINSGTQSPRALVENREGGAHAPEDSRPRFVLTSSVCFVKCPGMMCYPACLNMIEHESHSHAHHTGLPWLDLILAGSAIFISIVSLIVSIHHGRTMEKLVSANEKQVEASTLPILRFTTGNVLGNSGVIHFDVTNGGTGPAIVEWLRVKWDGRPTDGPSDLLDRCCRRQTQRAPSIWQNVASGMTLPAGQSESIFQVRAEGVDPDSYHLLDADARFKIEVEGCYCSVLDECWITDFKVRPRIVRSCESIPDSQRW
jgi:hypothetical protein